MAPFPNLRTERLILRRFRPDDVPALLAYRNDPEIIRYDGLQPISEEQARTFIADQAVTPAGIPGLWIQIAIELPGVGLIGDCGFQLNESPLGTAEVGYRLRRDQWGKGYAAEAVSTLLDWAFGTLGVHRVVAIIDTRNTHSIALVRRLGFRHEGTFLQSYPEPDGWSDEYLYAILDREWLNLQQNKIDRP